MFRVPIGHDILTAQDEASCIVLDTLSLPYFLKYPSLISYIYIIVIYVNTVKVSHCEICHPCHSGEILAQPTLCPWPDRFNLLPSMCVGVRWGVSPCLWLQMFVKSQRRLLTNRKTYVKVTLLIETNLGGCYWQLLIGLGHIDGNLWNGDCKPQLLVCLSGPGNYRPVFEQSTTMPSARQQASAHREPVSDVCLGRAKHRKSLWHPSAYIT